MEQELYKLFNVHLYKNNNSYVISDSNPEGIASAVSTTTLDNSSSVDPGDIQSGSISGNLEYTGGYLQSANFVSGTIGWKLSSDGTLTAVNATLSGTITSTAGTIGGFTIGSSTIVGGDVTLDSAGSIIVTQSIGTVKLSSSGFEFRVATTTNAAIRLFAGSSTPIGSAELRFSTGGLGGTSAELNFASVSNNTGNFSPVSGDTIDLGTASNYFNEINYKTLTDRGCLGWFDDGVELVDGRKVNDIEAMKSVKRHPSRKTIYGVPMLDYSTMPKAVYKPAPIAETDVYEGDKIRWKKGEKMGEDGAETTALISIMFGAIKELSAEIDKLKEKK